MSMIPEYRDAWLNQIVEEDNQHVPMEMDEAIEFYSYHDPHIADYNNKEPHERRYIAYRETPKGYWIVPTYDCYGNIVNTRSKKWLRKQYPNDRTKRKLFAYRDKTDALYSYYRKKLEHLRHLERKHNHIKTIVRKLENQADFFGDQRPILSHIDDFLRHPASQPLKPLERQRPIHGFIEEQEFIV